MLETMAWSHCCPDKVGLLVTEGLKGQDAGYFLDPSSEYRVCWTMGILGGLAPLAGPWGLWVLWEVALALLPEPISAWGPLDLLQSYLVLPKPVQPQCWEQRRSLQPPSSLTSGTLSLLPQGGVRDAPGRSWPGHPSFHSLQMMHSKPF